MTAVPTFRSVIASTITAFLDLKRALGCQCVRETAVLSDLDRCLAARRATALTVNHFAAWAATLAHITPRVRRDRMRIVRNLCLYQQRTDPDCFVPDPGGFPKAEPPRPPFIFSQSQIADLLRAATGLRPTHLSPLRAEVFRLAITLLYTAGLRQQELVRLTVPDYDPSQRTLHVRESKFHKSRLTALSTSAAHEAERYLEARQRIPCADGAPLLANLYGPGQAYSCAGIVEGLQSLFRAVGIRDAEGRLPRVHSLRHTHAVHVLLRWYRAGVDPQAKLPMLAASMGHVSVNSTAYYLTLLDPVVEEASVRFARHVRTVLDPPAEQSHA